jgi:hypothetical protein
MYLEEIVFFLGLHSKYFLISNLYLIIVLSLLNKNYEKNIYLWVYLNCTEEHLYFLFYVGILCVPVCVCARRRSNGSLAHARHALYH